MKYFLRLVFLLFLLTAVPALNPFSPKASLLRHWARHFPSDQIPSILLTKSSPLNFTQLSTFTNYISSHSLASHIPSFCASANLFCILKSSTAAISNFSGEADFSSYSNQHFALYQKDALHGTDAFRTYSHGENTARDSFLRYAADGNSRLEVFRSYSDDTNAGQSRFSNYQNQVEGGSSDFDSYGNNSNINRHDFTAYGAGSGSTPETFNSYTENSNVVRNGFRSYGSEANAADGIFSTYAKQSNIGMNDFKMYSEAGNGALDQFRGYGISGNVARNDFLSYESESNGGSAQFDNYGNEASQSLNGFRSYGKGSNAVDSFTNYGNTSFPSKNDFAEYGKDAGGVASLSFSEYVGNDTGFNQYFRSKTSFSSYSNFTGGRRSQFHVEAGKFFREADLVQGKRIPIPDIRDKMPERSFLPKVLADKLPFSSIKLPDMVRMLAADDLEAVMAKTISDCERPAVKDETKRCVTSIESMVEFSVSELGKKAIVSTTANTSGWGQVVEVGEVRARNGGNATRAVSCHQSLFPYLVYYCHRVPRVKVYHVDLLDEKNGRKVNQGVGICHLDTTQWSATHAAFVALGHGPGKIEVCHWIFERDLIWVARE